MSGRDETVRPSASTWGDHLARSLKRITAAGAAITGIDNVAQLVARRGIKPPTVAGSSPVIVEFVTGQR